MSRVTSPSPNRQPLPLWSHLVLATAVITGLVGIFLGGTLHWVLLGVAVVMIFVEAVVRRRMLTRNAPPSPPARRR